MLIFIHVAETLGMEAGGSYDRRGSIISPSGFYDDHPKFSYFGNIGSSGSDVVDGSAAITTVEKDNSTIPMHRIRGISETHYADTEVILINMQLFFVN